MFMLKVSALSALHLTVTLFLLMLRPWPGFNFIKLINFLINII